MKVLLILILVLLSGRICGQQGNESNDKQARKCYEQAGRYLSAGDYTNAIEELRKAVKKDPGFITAFQQLGDLNRKLRHYQEAAENYRRVLSISSEFSSLTYFGLAESELNLGEYSSAFRHFNRFISFEGISENGKKLAIKYIRDCRFSIEAIKHPVEFKPFNLGPAINTREEEYLPTVTADEGQLIFTRRTGNNEDFYQSVRKSGMWQQATYLSKEINTPNLNEGAQCISPDGLYLFFTGCNRPDGVGRCDIYVCKREENTWSEPFNIGPPVNTRGWESQPSLSADGRTLYFVSNRPGGFGGYDIWSTELLEDGKWAPPVNLGPSVNTPYDEHSPFIHPDNQTLYFSSNGWPGFGNKDLFLSRRDHEGKWQEPVNLGYPINTAGEESSLTVSADGQTAFFASDMKGGAGGMDIYSFSLYPQAQPLPVTYVRGKVEDAATRSPLSARVVITDLTQNKVIFDEESEEGTFLATMVVGGNFGLSVRKDEYLFYSENFSPTQANVKSPYSLQVSLRKIQAGSRVVLRNIFFETNKAELRPESMAELQTLLSFLKSNPHVAILIGGHTDHTGNTELNQKLSENRAKNVYTYLIENGIAPSRLTFKGFGSTSPVASNATEEGRQLNRRTEFTIEKY